MQIRYVSKKSVFCIFVSLTELKQYLTSVESAVVIITHKAAAKHHTKLLQNLQHRMICLNKTIGSSKAILVCMLKDNQVNLVSNLIHDPITKFPLIFGMKQNQWFDTADWVVTGVVYKDIWAHFDPWLDVIPDTNVVTEKVITPVVSSNEAKKHKLSLFMRIPALFDRLFDIKQVRKIPNVFFIDLKAMSIQYIGKIQGMKPESIPTFTVQTPFYTGVYTPSRPIDVTTETVIRHQFIPTMYVLMGTNLRDACVSLDNNDTEIRHFIFDPVGSWQDLQTRMALLKEAMI